MDRQCLPCDNTAAASLPAREEVVRTEHWRVAHAFDAALAGWLVVLPTEHVTDLAALHPQAAAELGPLLQRLTAALQEVVGCTRTYVMLFAEAEGFSHVHLHVVPRMPDQPEELRGPRIFGALGAARPDRVPEEEMDRVALAVRDLVALEGAVP